MQSLYLLLALLSVSAALPTCPSGGGRESTAMPVAQQEEQPQSEQPQCSPEMLMGFRVLAPVMLEAEAADVQNFLPDGAKYVDRFNTTMLIPSASSQQQQQPQSNATQGQQSDSSAGEKIQVKFTNNTEVSTTVLQNSAFAISWIFNMSEAKGQQQGQQQANQPGQGLSSVDVMPIRIQLVDSEGTLSNVTETFGVLNAGESQESRNSPDEGSQSQEDSQRQTGTQSQQSANQTEQTGGTQQDSQEDSKSGAVVVLLGDEIPAGFYSFLATIQLNKTEQPQSNVTCRILTQPFEIRSSMNVTSPKQSPDGSSQQNVTAGNPQQNATSDQQ